MRILAPADAILASQYSFLGWTCLELIADFIKEHTRAVSVVPGQPDRNGLLTFVETLKTRCRRHFFFYGMTL